MANIKDNETLAALKTLDDEDRYESSGLEDDGGQRGAVQKVTWP